MKIINQRKCEIKIYISLMILQTLVLFELSSAQGVSVRQSESPTDFYINDGDNFIYNEPDLSVYSKISYQNRNAKRRPLGKHPPMEQPPTAEVFITKGNTEDTIQLSDGVTKEILITQEMVRNDNDFNHVVLLCNASYPIEWIYQGVGAPRLYTTQIRSFGDFFDSKTYGHSSILVLVQERWDELQTGSYICQGLGQKINLSTRFHLYFKGEFGFPSLQNMLVQLKEADSWEVILPCPTSDPTATIQLFKIDPLEGTQNLTSHSAFKYDPRKGFILDLNGNPNPYGIYTCKYKEMEMLWKIELVPAKAKEVQVLPNAGVVEMSNLAQHSFMCKAKEPIILSLPNTVDFGRIDYSNSTLDNFPYLGVLSIPPHVPLHSVANYFKVNCLSKRTRRVLHSWEYTNFGKEELKISYDKSQKRLLCCSKSGLTPIHKLAKCETVTDCNIKRHCFLSGRCDYAYPPQFVDAPRGCTALEFMDDFPSHIMQCSVGQLQKEMMLTSNIDNDELILYDGTMPETERILKMTILSQRDPNFAKIRCVASIFFFSTNLVFVIEKEDGSFIFPEESQIENVNSYGPTLNTKISQDIRKIHCFAPLTRSSDWRNVSMNIEDIVGEEAVKLQASHPSSPVLSHFIQGLIGREETEQVITSVHSSTSVSTSLRNKRGQLIKVIQDI